MFNGELQLPSLPPSKGDSTLSTNGRPRSRWLDLIRDLSAVINLIRAGRWAYDHVRDFIVDLFDGLPA